ncbi:hypothetical protein [Desulforhabdus sp. TSK]|uniref:hypothetical protein n=1 Tax=Desulforhabdus sp. TSK TaxID=2925014 RepID=UPI001FC855E8|nr:hypothetical protein [Desulforhabdus sp. TSK]GKT09529.1 hypothetical protein DSTSK_28340 [Desulforhabdus sp. TSK]
MIAQSYRTGAEGKVDLVLEVDCDLVAVEVKHTTTVGGRDLRSLRDFTAEDNARLGVVINNDIAPRRCEDRTVGIPYMHL